MRNTVLFDSVTIENLTCMHNKRDNPAMCMQTQYKEYVFETASFNHYIYAWQFAY